MQNAKFKMQTTELVFLPSFKIANGGGNFVRCAVSESGAYLGVCEHLRRKQGAKFTRQNDFHYKVLLLSAKNFHKLSSCGTGAKISTNSLRTGCINVSERE